MTPSTRGMLIVIALSAAIALLTPLSIRAARARARHDTSHAKLVRVLDQARELKDLQSSITLPSSSTFADRAGKDGGGGGAGGVASKVAASLAACGLPASTMTSLHPDTPTPIADANDAISSGGTTTSGEGGRLLRHRATLTLGGDALTLPRLGDFLAAWRTREPAWTVTSLDVSPQSRPSQASSTSSMGVAGGAGGAGGGGGGGGGGDLPLRVVVSLECVALEQTAAPNSSRNTSPSRRPASITSPPQSPTPGPPR